MKRKVSLTCLVWGHDFWLRHITAIALMVSVWPIVVLAAPPLKLDILGDWQVESVRNDEGATHKLVLTEDDQRFVGRFLHFGSKEVTFLTPDGEAKCGDPSISPEFLTAGDLVAETMAGRGGAPVTPLPRDYGLPFSPSDHVEANWLACRVGFLGPGLGARNKTWFLDLPQHRLAMGYFASTILILGPVPLGTPPKASFLCGEARTPSEKAICSSASLASFDRSISKSYADDLQQFKDVRDPDATLKLKQSQQDWLRIRNQCGGDGGCLLKSMSARLEALSDTSAFTGD
jgi:uncharacterized protein YecT (DUF1311 family)